VSGNLTNASTQSGTWNAAGATLQFTGGGSHPMNVSGPVGSYGWGTLQIASGNTLEINGTSATATATSNAGTIEQTSGSAASLGAVSGPASSSGGATVYAGNLIVGDGSTPSQLTATKILQNTLTINAGSTVTIAPSGGGIPAVEVAPASAVATSDVAMGAATAESDLSNDPFTAIQEAIDSGSISSAKGQQLEDRIAAIERLAATDPGLDVSLLEDRVLAALPTPSIWSASGTSPFAETGSDLLAMDSSTFASPSGSTLGGATAAFAPAADFGSSPAAVPEPSTLLLAVFGGVGVLIAIR
jgi:hypothetical protein